MAVVLSYQCSVAVSSITQSTVILVYKTSKNQITTCCNRHEQQLIYNNINNDCFMRCVRDVIIPLCFSCCYVLRVIWKLTREKVEMTTGKFDSKRVICRTLYSNTLCYDWSDAVL